MLLLRNQPGLVGCVIPEKSTSFPPPPPPQWKAQYFYPLFHPDFQNLLMSPPFPQYFQVQGDLTPPLPSRLLDAIIFIAEDSFR